jgi:hypothetical protein
MSMPMSSGRDGHNPTRTESLVPPQAVRHLVDNVMRAVRDDRERDREVHVEPRPDLEYVDDDRKTNWGAF